MFRPQKVKVVALQLLALGSLLPDYNDCLIITSVLAGDKKFKTISFHTNLLKPLMFEKEMPLTEFRRHRTLKPPKFDIDINIPIKLPLEEEYPKEEPYKPVWSDIFFQSGHDIPEPSYGAKSEPVYDSKPQPVYEAKPQPHYPPKKVTYKDEAAAASRIYQQVVPRPNFQSQPPAPPRPSIKRNSPDQTETLQTSLLVNNVNQQAGINQLKAEPRASSNPMQRKESVDQEASKVHYATSSNGYDQDYQKSPEYVPEFIPGGYVNLQLSGPVGGPKPTYEDYDREKWAQQLSQAPGAMPYPILNYQQLQNFYGGLGTFTNGLADDRYEPMGLLEKLKSCISHFTSKFHLKAAR